jgi:FkbM family methyltransferase
MSLNITNPEARASMATILGVDIPTIELCDVGPLLEGEERYAALVKQNLANVNGFEPNPVELEKLRAAGRPRRQYFPYFLGNGGEATFHLARYPGCSSLYEADPSIIDLFTAIGATLPEGNFAVTQTEAVRTTRLDDVPELPMPDYLKLDIQGAELDVLQSGPERVATAVVIELEVEFVPLYKNQPLFGDVQIYLQSQGFLLHKFLDISGRAFRPVMVGNNPYTPMSQALWADAIFVKDFSKLERYSDAQLLKAAVILHTVYHSHDLTHLLLAAYDQRTGAGTAGRFFAALRGIKDLPIAFMNVKGFA